MSDAPIEMTPMTPLGGQSARIDTHGPVTLTEVPNTALASYVARLGQEKPAKAALGKFLGATPPGPGAAYLADLSAIWAGPDQWMVIAPHDSHEDLAAQLATKAKGSSSVTEQNDAWCRFDLTGAGLAAVFELLCPVNLRSCSGSEATRTSIEHLGCFLIVTSAESVTVLGPRSSAGSLHHALLTAMRSAH